MERRDKACIACGAVSIFFAVASVAAIIVWPTLFNIVFQDLILQNLVLDGPHSEPYDKWNTTSFKNAPVIYEQYSIFNVTNADDVAENGTKPIMQEIGPFTYRYNKVKIDVEFLENNTKVKYIDWLYYTFEPSLSVADPKDVLIRTINPPYLGILSQTHSEYAMNMGYTAVEFRRFFTFLRDVFVRDLGYFYAPDWLHDLKSSLTEKYRSAHNVTQEQADLFFLSQWANSTEPDQDDSEWDLIKVSLGSSGPTSIPLSAAQKIFDPNFPLSLGMLPSQLPLNLSTTPTKSWAFADSNLQRYFGISSTQIDAVSRWLQRADVAAAIQSNLLAELTVLYNVSEVFDIPCAQWGRGAAWPRSVVESYPNEFNVAPEFFFFAQAWYQRNPGYFTVQQCQQLFYGTDNITDAKAFGTFMLDLGQAVVTNNFTDPSRRWLLTLNSTYELFAYISYVTLEESRFGLAKRMAEGSNLMATRTAYEWIWDYTDKLMLEFMPTAPPPSFKHNMSSPEFARKNYLPSIAWTGVGNYSRISEFVQYRGYSWIDWLYPGFNMTVSGSTEDGQFRPFLTKRDQIGVFQEEYLRYFPMKAVGNSEVKGVKAIRFEPLESVWNEHDHYWQHIQGFANMSAQFNGTPAFLCNPHFYGVPKRWAQKLDGVLPANRSRDWIYVDVEPNTGHVINLRKGVQANLYIPEDAAWFDEFHPRMAKGLFIPMLIGYQFTTLTDELVEMFNHKVYLGLTLGQVAFWTFVALATALFLLGLLLIGLTIRRVRSSAFYFDRRAYQQINSQS